MTNDPSHYLSQYPRHTIRAVIAADDVHQQMSEMRLRSHRHVGTDLPDVRLENRVSARREDLDRRSNSDRRFDRVYGGVSISENHDRDLRRHDPARHGGVRMGKDEAGAHPSAAEAFVTSHSVSDRQHRRRHLRSRDRLLPVVRIGHVPERMDALASV